MLVAVVVVALGLAIVCSIVAVQYRSNRSALKIITRVAIIGVVVVVL